MNRAINLSSLLLVKNQCKILLRTFSQQATNVIAKRPHTPVMASEVCNFFDIKPGNSIIDMTFGAGGHTTQLLESEPNLKIFALDRDPTAYEYALALQQKYPDNVIPLLGKFSQLPQLLDEHNVSSNSIDGILFDFGCSSMQMDTPDRGFSISHNAKLDMRMNKISEPDTPTAADVLSILDEEELVKIFRVYGEEKNAKKIARAIVDVRYSLKKIETTKELADLVASSCASDIRMDKLQRPAHTATKVFQALRIFVNNELNEINYAMVLAQHYLRPKGRMIAITFHSLEDTIVKRHIRGNVINNAANPLPQKYSNPNVVHNKETIDSFTQSNWQQIHKHVYTPTDAEVEQNPRSRSAKLRVAEKQT